MAKSTYGSIPVDGKGRISEVLGMGARVGRGASLRAGATRAVETEMAKVGVPERGEANLTPFGRRMPFFRQKAAISAGSGFGLALK